MKTALLFVGLLFLLATAMISAEENGDKYVQPQEMPFVAYLDHDGEPCTASVLNKFWVLTAGGCVEVSTNDTVRVGSLFADVGGTVHEVTRKLFHPYYHSIIDYSTNVTSTKYIYNYALLQISPKLGRNMEPARISDERASKYFGEDSTFAGFGSSFEFFENNPYIWREKSYRLRKRTSHLTKNNTIYWQPFNYEFSINEDPYFGLNTMGDLGAPIAVQQDGKWVQIGMLSQNNFGLGVFVDIGEASEWIRDVISNSD